MGNREDTAFSYFFLPFLLSGDASYQSAVDYACSCKNWDEDVYSVKYMLKYISDKFDTENKKECVCRSFVYKNTDSSYRKYKKFYCLSEKDDKKIIFSIDRVSMHIFSTGIGVVALKIIYDDISPYGISDACYNLKKVKRNIIYALEDSSIHFTFFDAAEKITEGICGNSPVNLFYFSGEGNERANVFTYAEEKNTGDIAEKLFFLRNCYDDRFIYTLDEKTESAEIYRASESVYWGITKESLVCLADPHNKDSDFIKGKFFGNIDRQYFILYLLLLHQRYALYMFMMKVCRDQSYEELEKYKTDITEFENDFVFSCVSEVPQYQKLYDRISDVFDLKRMYEDVHEPLFALAEARKNEEQKKRDEESDRVNNILFWLSVMTIVSVLADGYAVVSNYTFGLLPKGIFIAAQAISGAAMFILFLRVIIKNRGRKHKKDE